MQYDEFIGQVQNRAQLASKGEAVKATRATLQVLGQRLFGGEAKDLASQLPEEIGLYVTLGKEKETFGVDEFFRRVSDEEGAPLEAAVHHAEAVMSVVREAVTPGEIDDLRSQLPNDFERLFQSGTEGRTMS